MPLVISTAEHNLRRLCASGHGGETAEWALAEIERLRANVTRLEAGLARIADNKCWNSCIEAAYLLGRKTV